jgi:PAS domain S-box-containing protein
MDISAGGGYYDEAGKLYRMSGTIMDISDRKQAESALRVSETKLQCFVDSNIVGVIMADLNGNLHEANNAFLQMVGYTQEDLKSGNLRWRDMTPPEWIEVDERAIAQIRQTGSCPPFEKEYFHKNGTRVPILIGIAMLPDSQENCFCFILELSDRKRAEQRLRESEELLRLGMQVAGFALAKFDYAANTVALSPEAAALYGLPPNELVVPRSRIHATFHPEEREELAHIIEQVIDPAGPCWFARDHRVVWPNGEVRWLTVRKQVFFDRESECHRPIYAVLAAIDVTDRKRAELALIESEKRLTERNQELNRFTHTVSHDLKAPLRAIANLSQWIADDLEGQLSKENQRNIDLLQKRVYRMESLIDGLLVYSRIGRTQVATQTVDVGELLIEILDSLVPPPGFTIDLQPQMPTIMAKRLLLSQVFSNLISNAIKHCDRPDGRIEISATQKGQYYEFSVADNGPGIAPANHERIFGIFQTLKGRDVKESTGIGLSIVKKIIETEGGEIAVESELGSGATFRFTWLTEP